MRVLGVINSVNNKPTPKPLHNLCYLHVTELQGMQHSYTNLQNWRYLIAMRAGHRVRTRSACVRDICILWQSCMLCRHLRACIADPGARTHAPVGTLIAADCPQPFEVLVSEQRLLQRRFRVH